MSRICFLTVSFCALLFSSSYAQVNHATHQLSIKKTADEISLDGKLDEAIWNSSDKAKDFIQIFPTDSLPATSQTEVSITFDEQYLYVGGICHENSNKKHIIQSLKRDFSWSRNENFGIYFDPYGDFTNGFGFVITPAGVQSEGLVTDGQNYLDDWDTKWYSAVDDTGDYWSFEFKIPLKSIRYNPEGRHWNMVFIRLDLKNNEQTSWAPIPQGYNSSFVLGGRLNFEEQLPNPGANVSFIPFVSSRVSKNHEDGQPTEYDADVGFDAKIALSSALNLDLTFNPDFSQVEVDQQVTNLNRFEIFFPERRQFFLENNDLFGSQGFGGSRPFFSRRVGIASNSVTIDNEEESLSGQVPIQYGARLSGKIGSDWRVGILNMMTKEEQALAMPQQMYSMAVIQRKLFTQSNIGFMVVNKNTFGINLSDTSKYLHNQSLFKEKTTSTDSSLYLNNFNTVYGTDFNFRSADNKWNSKVFYHLSISPQSKNQEFVTGASLGYTVRKLRLSGFVAAVSEDYNAEVGFIRRKDIKQYGVSASYFSYPQAGKINNHGPTSNYFYVADFANNRSDYNVNLGYQIQFLNTARISMVAEHRFEKLRREFDPSGTGSDIKLIEGDEFSWNTFSARFNTDNRKIISFQGGTTVGGFYNGERINVNGQLNVRYQPYGGVALRFDYNKIDLPSPHNSAEFWLIGPRIDFTFTDKLFLTTFVQYNEQADNLNINTRFQWRYKPASDLFVVYTDNYFPQSLGVKNRALIMKLNYWFNL